MGEMGHLVVLGCIGYAPGRAVSSCVCRVLTCCMRSSLEMSLPSGPGDNCCWSASPFSLPATKHVLNVNKFLIPVSHVLRTSSSLAVDLLLVLGKVIFVGSVEGVGSVGLLEDDGVVLVVTLNDAFRCRSNNHHRIAVLSLKQNRHSVH